MKKQHLLAAIIVCNFAIMVLLFKNTESRIPDSHIPPTTQTVVEDNTPQGFGVGQASTSFMVDRWFLGVASRLSDSEVGVKITEASGCKVIEDNLIEKYKKDGIRHIISEKIVEFQTPKTQIKIRSVSKADVSGGWIVDITRQIGSNEHIKNYYSETRITSSGFDTKIKMSSRIMMRGVDSEVLTRGSEIGLKKSRDEFIRQME